MRTGRVMPVMRSCPFLRSGAKVIRASQASEQAHAMLSLDMLSLSPSIILAGAGLCAIAVRLVIWRVRRAQLPPGPPAHPIHGHVDLIKSPTLHIIAADWVRSYGECLERAGFVCPWGLTSTSLQATWLPYIIWTKTS